MWVMVLMSLQFSCNRSGSYCSLLPRVRGVVGDLGLPSPATNVGSPKKSSAYRSAPAGSDGALRPSGHIGYFTLQFA